MLVEIVVFEIVVARWDHTYVWAGADVRHIFLEVLQCEVRRCRDIPCVGVVMGNRYVVLKDEPSNLQ